MAFGEVLNSEAGVGNVDWSFTPTAGDALLVWCFRRDGAGLATAAPTGWTHLETNGTIGLDVDGIDLYGKLSDGTETDCITVAAPNTRWWVCQVEGADVAGALTNAVSDSGTAILTGSVSPTGGAPSVIFGGAAVRNQVGATFSPGGSWTEQYEDVYDGQHPTAVVVSRVVSSPSGSYDPAMTATVSTSWHGITVALSGAPIIPEGYDVHEILPPGDSIGFVGTLDDAYDRSIRPVRNQPGSGQFTINRYSPNATAAILKPGNLVKVCFPDIDPGYIFAYFMEKGNFGLVSTDEQGGEEIKIGGRGALSYWDRAVWLSQQYAIPWWDAGWGTPPSGARGHVEFVAGTYWRFTISGGVITAKTSFTTPGFEAYFDTRQTFQWPSAGSKRFLVKIMAGETNAGWYVHPHQDGVTETMPTYAVGTSTSVLLSDISADTPGAILYHLYQEGTDPGRPTQPIPLMTIDFTATLDSNGDPWSTTDALAGLTAELGETYLDTIAKLVSTGVIDVEMGPDLDMHAYNAQGRDLTSTTFAAGKVRFEKGVNIADRLSRERDDNPVATFIEVVGTDNAVGQASLPDAATRVAREAATTGDSNVEATLEAIGLAALNSRLIRSDAIGFRIATGDDDAAGLYLPGPEGTANGDFWLGDVVTLHTGTGEQDFDDEDERVFAITISEDEAGNLDVTPEVGSVLGEAERRLYSGSRPATVAFGARSQFSDTEVAETSAEVEVHIADATGAHSASAVSFAPTGPIAATDVQAAIVEVASELIADIAAHLADTTDAHDASAISVLDTGGNFTGTDVEAVLAELDAAISAGGIPATIVDAKGDIIAATAADTVARLAAAANGAALITASGESSGLKWRLNNDAASAAPTVNDDSGDGYQIGSRWLDTTADKEYVCLDASAGAAVWVETTGSGGGGGAPTTAKYVTTAADGTLSDEIVIPGLAGSADRPPASPNASDDEFDTTDTSDPMTGWTTLQTPTAHDINSTIKSHYRVHKTATTASTGQVGIYKAWTPSNGDTITCKLTDYAWFNINFMRGGQLFLGEATPGKMMIIHWVQDTLNGVYGDLAVNYYTAPGSYSSSAGTVVRDGFPAPLYLRIRYNTSTSIDYLYSLTGLIFHPILLAHNPAFTVGSFGLSIEPANATYDGEAIFDWVRKNWTPGT